MTDGQIDRQCMNKTHAHLHTCLCAYMPSCKHTHTCECVSKTIHTCIHRHAYQCTCMRAWHWTLLRHTALHYIITCHWVTVHDVTQTAASHCISHSGAYSPIHLRCMLRGRFYLSLYTTFYMTFTLHDPLHNTKTFAALYVSHHTFNNIVYRTLHHTVH